MSDGFFPGLAAAVPLLPAGASLLVLAALMLLFRRRLRLAMPACLAVAGGGLLWLALAGAPGARGAGPPRPEVCSDSRNEHPLRTGAEGCPSGLKRESVK